MENAGRLAKGEAAVRTENPQHSRVEQGLTLDDYNIF